MERQNPAVAAGGASIERTDDPARRRRMVLLAGYRGESGAARAALKDPDPAVRAGALGALARIGAASVEDVTDSLADPQGRVRRRACEVGAGLGGRGKHSILVDALRVALDDEDPLVVESACWALGECGDPGAVGPLGVLCADHPDTRCREAAVAALGAIGDPSALRAVLGRLDDKPTVRRRAVVALAAFSGPEVDQALRHALEDRDWQVRQAAEILLEG